MNTAQHQRITLSPEHRLSAAQKLVTYAITAVVAFGAVRVATNSDVLGVVAAVLGAAAAVGTLRLLTGFESDYHPEHAAPPRARGEEFRTTSHGPGRANKSAPGSTSRGVAVVRAGASGKAPATKTAATTTEVVASGGGLLDESLASTVETAGHLVDTLRITGLATLLATGDQVPVEAGNAVEVVIRDDRGTPAGDHAVQAALKTPTELLAFLARGGPKQTGGIPAGWKVLSSSTQVDGHWTAVVSSGKQTFSFRLAAPTAFKAAVRGTTEERVIDEPSRVLERNHSRTATR